MTTTTQATEARAVTGPQAFDYLNLAKYGKALRKDMEELFFRNRLCSAGLISWRSEARDALAKAAFHIGAHSDKLHVGRLVECGLVLEHRHDDTRKDPYHNESAKVVWEHAVLTLLVEDSGVESRFGGRGYNLITRLNFK